MRAHKLIRTALWATVAATLILCTEAAAQANPFVHSSEGPRVPIVLVLVPGNAPPSLLRRLGGADGNVVLLSDAALNSSSHFGGSTQHADLGSERSRRAPTI